MEPAIVVVILVCLCLAVLAAFGGVLLGAWIYQRGRGGLSPVPTLGGARRPLQVTSGDVAVPETPKKPLKA